MAPGRDDGSTGPGAHPEAEAVRLRPTAVVRLERALAHCWAPGLVTVLRGTRGCRGRWRVAFVSRTRRSRSAPVLRARRSGRRRLDRATLRGADPPVKRARPDRRHRPTGHCPSTAASQPARHAGWCRGTDPLGRKNSGPGCGQPVAGDLAASLVSRGSPVLPHAVAAAGPTPRPPGRCHTPDTSGATDVHRLWTRMWTAVGRDPAGTNDRPCAGRTPGGITA